MEHWWQWRREFRPSKRNQSARGSCRCSFARGGKRPGGLQRPRSRTRFQVFSEKPSFQIGRNSSSIKLHINRTMPLNIPEKKMRVLMGKLQRRNYKFERRKPAILMLALGDASRHSRSSLSLTNSMKTPVLSLITVLTVAAFLGCQSQKKEETAMTSTGTTHAASTTSKKSTTKKTSASTEASPAAKKTTKKKAAAEESASPTASPSATP